MGLRIARTRQAQWRRIEQAHRPDAPKRRARLQPQPAQVMRNNVGQSSSKRFRFSSEKGVACR